MKNQFFGVISLFFLSTTLAGAAQADAARSPNDIASDLVTLNRANMRTFQDKMISFNPFEGAGCLLTISNHEGHISFEPALAEFQTVGLQVVITDDLSHTIESLEMKSKADAAKATALFWELHEACQQN
jgi:hypothetical protein